MSHTPTPTMPQLHTRPLGHKEPLHLVTVAEERAPREGLARRWMERAARSEEGMRRSSQQPAMRLRPITSQRGRRPSASETSRPSQRRTPSRPLARHGCRRGSRRSSLLCPTKKPRRYLRVQEGASVQGRDESGPGRHRSTRLGWAGARTRDVVAPELVVEAPSAAARHGRGRGRGPAAASRAGEGRHLPAACPVEGGREGRRRPTTCPMKGGSERVSAEGRR
jgi:hypothetical protein